MKATSNINIPYCFSIKFYYSKVNCVLILATAICLPFVSNEGELDVEFLSV